MSAVVISNDGNSRVNVYDAPSDDATALGSLPVETEVEVLEVSETSNWVHIRYASHEGYMPDSNLRFEL